MYRSAFQRYAATLARNEEKSLCRQQYRGIFSPHSCTVHLDTIKVLLPTAEQNNRFKRILKLTLEFIFNVNFNIILKQLFCASVGNKTLIIPWL